MIYYESTDEYSFENFDYESENNEEWLEEELEWQRLENEDEFPYDQY